MVPPAREELRVSDIRNGKSVVKRWASVETKRVFVGVSKEGDESRERVSEVADRRWDGKSVIIRPAENFGMDIMSDDSSVSDVDWNHGFLHGGIKHDLSRFGVTKDVKFYTFINVSMRIGLS